MADVTFLTDSSTVLQEIRSQKCHYQTFLADCVGEILEDTNSHQVSSRSSFFLDAKDLSLLSSPKELTEKTVLTTDEISEASNAIMAIVQQPVSYEEIFAIKALNPIRSSSPFLTALPFFESEGILRVGGRLGRSTLS